MIDLFGEAVWKNLLQKIPRKALVQESLFSVATTYIISIY